MDARDKPGHDEKQIRIAWKVERVTPEHVVIVVEENHGYSQIVGSSSAPYINNTLIAEGASFIVSGEWWVALFPGLVLMAAVFCFNLMGDGLRDIVDPLRRT